MAFRGRGSSSQIASRVIHRSTTIGDNKCWTSTDPQYKISKTVERGKKPKAAFAFLVTRFFCSLSNPTEQRWQNLIQQDQATTTPFGHFYGRGQKVEGADGCLHRRGGARRHGHPARERAHQALCKHGSLATLVLGTDLQAISVFSLILEESAPALPDVPRSRASL